jgi:cell pole-organizing protein PopZ
MARKIVNRKELRAQADAAEARGKTAKKADKPAKAKKEKKEKAAKEPKKPAAKKPSRKKTVKEARMKAYWGVFNPAMKRLAMFEYADKKAAEKKAAELGATHFIQLVKEAIAE